MDMPYINSKGIVYKYGEFFPARIKASPYDIYIDFFQFDKNGDPKGIIQINLN